MTGHFRPQRRNDICLRPRGCASLSWQITPRALTAAIADPDRAAAKRAFEAMMQMRKDRHRCD